MHILTYYRDILTTTIHLTTLSILLYLSLLLNHILTYYLDIFAPVEGTFALLPRRQLVRACTSGARLWEFSRN